ncbi:MAG: imidazole glycerol phosphate synthase subunit HisF [Oscillospiraceae bacterium]|nr:imidazole glycerol phosphate synthase subunit HisF [Oscillospiraceae bacterium]
MVCKRIIPCLDTIDGRVVKGVKFENMRQAGDPAELARLYSEQGADGVVVLDITATVENRDTLIQVVERTAGAVSVPLTVGGGIRTLQDMERLFAAGADRLSVNSAAVANKMLIREAARAFGAERLVVAVDARRTPTGGYEVLVRGGQVGAGLDAVAWAKEVEALGAGEILLTSKDADGTKDGYDIEMTRAVADAVAIPVVASGGCGCLEDFYKALTEGGADGALAASLFHFGELTIPQTRAYLKSRGVPVR